MYKHILIATDGSEMAQKGVDHGLSLAKNLDAKVVVVTVTEPFPIYAGEGWALGPGDFERYDADQIKFANEILSPIKAFAEKVGLKADVLHVPDARAAGAIVDTAQKFECNLIVMASHGRRGIKRLLLGSQTSEVLATSIVPVLVVR
ncbi:universal stress protein [Manganibacter manganicus]|uniref:Universal stress protein n=1 Tax=Manganibacter manganicus TaxID=1873176 RepID=A0A1V8RJN5_9HYPH|nr:universal stress protein [Pseudaminobacter manganicus]OQM73417.1 universal stress protein UspA [Pseudaminobacter manganicus]